MRFTIEARLVDDSGPGESVLLGEFERPVDKLDPAILGLTLEEGRELLHKAQQFLSASQVAGWLRWRSTCDRCGWAYPHKDTRTVTYRTVYGRVELPSPRWYECLCKCNIHHSQRHGAR